MALPIRLRSRLFLVVVALAVIGITLILPRALELLDPPDDEDLIVPAAILEAPRTFVALFGIDAFRLADVILVGCFDVEQKSVQVVSVPRDTRALVPGRGIRKINSAYAFGGPDLMVEALEVLLDIEIDHYVAMDFRGFERIVDLVGGVPLHVEDDMYYVDRAGGLYIDISAGEQLLDDKSALDYVRFRADGLGDIGRIRRQQRFIRAFVEALAGADADLAHLAEEGLAALRTDMTVWTSLALALVTLEAWPDRIEISTLPGSPGWVDRVSYWLVEPETAESIFAERPPAEEETPGGE